MSDSEREDRLLAAVREYESALQAQRAVDRREFLARYADLPELVEYLDTLEELHHLGSAGSPTAPESLGDFRIVREIGRGGMGVVYEAEQRSLGRRVALKVLPFAAAFDSRQLIRFQNEARAAAQLHHNHIVPVFGVGCDRGVHYYAMQLIDGRTLAELIIDLRRGGPTPPPPPLVASSQQRRLLSASISLVDTESYVGNFSSSRSAEAKGLSPSADVGDDAARSRRSSSLLCEQLASGRDESSRGEAPPSRGTALADTAVAGVTAGVTSQQAERSDREAARLMVQAARALDHAHQHGVVHRDIKPANLLLDRHGQLWITDFGLAQLQTGSELTLTGDLVGTLRYMSPEQASGQRLPLDHRTDIYSLGATFYELLTLRPLFIGATRPELLQQILHSEPTAPRQLRRAIPAELETILLKCLSKAPAERYATAGELADDLERFLDHRPILARRPSFVERLRKWMRRHPAVVGGAGLLLVLTVVGLLVSHALVTREQVRTREALEREKSRALEAERRLHQSRQLVELLIQVSEEELDDRAPYQGVRKRLLESALTHYQQLIDETGEDQVAAAELERARERVRQILADLVSLQRVDQAMLLGMDSVVEELKPDEAQKQRIRELTRRLNRERFDTLFDPELSVAEKRQQQLEQARASEQALAEVLLPAQHKRLRQIAVQMQGFLAFREPDVVKALNLTPGQRQRIREIEVECMMQAPGPPKFGGGRRGGAGHGGPAPGAVPPPPPFSLGRFREGMERCLALLTPEQRTRWDELTGPPFTPPSGPPMRPFGRQPRQGP